MAELTLPEPLLSARDEYRVWLSKQPLADRSRRAYWDQVDSYLAWLVDHEDPMAALAGGPERDWAARDYKRFLKLERKLSPASVNQALAAIDSLFRSRSLVSPAVEREQLAQTAPRALDEDEQRRFLRAVERCPSSRDRAIALMFLFAGLRLSELTELDVDDVAVTARKGMVVVRSGKGDRYREVPLNAACRDSITEWLTDRAELLETKGADTSGLWVSRLGAAMSKRSIEQAVDRLADDAGLEGATAHVLRHTFVTNLVRAGHDVVLVAELAGHRRLDTTRRYSLPSDADRAAAIESVTESVTFCGRVFSEVYKARAEYQERGVRRPADWVRKR